LCASQAIIILFQARICTTESSALHAPGFDAVLCGAALQARNILVSNWPADGIPELMEGFAQFMPANSTITFAMQGDPHPDWPTRIDNCRFNFVAAKQPTSVKVGGSSRRGRHASPVVGTYV
jgi:hypothetical protein